MSSRAHVEYDPFGDTVKIAVVRPHHILIWEPVSVRERNVDSNTVPTDDAWLRIGEDDARAMYEALAHYFGGAGHDTRALRKDYDAERARVDTFIAHLTKENQ